MSIAEAIWATAQPQHGSERRKRRNSEDDSGAGPSKARRGSTPPAVVELDCLEKYADLFHKATREAEAQLASDSDMIYVAMRLHEPAPAGLLLQAWAAGPAIFRVPDTFTAGDTMALAACKGQGTFVPRHVFRRATKKDLEDAGELMQGLSSQVEYKIKMKDGELMREVLRSSQESQQAVGARQQGVGSREQPLDLWVAVQPHGLGTLYTACGYTSKQSYGLRINGVRGVRASIKVPPSSITSFSRRGKNAPGQARATRSSTPPPSIMPTASVNATPSAAAAAGQLLALAGPSESMKDDEEMQDQELGQEHELGLALVLDQEQLPALAEEQALQQAQEQPQQQPLQQPQQQPQQQMPELIQVQGQMQEPGQLLRPVQVPEAGQQQGQGEAQDQGQGQAQQQAGAQVKEQANGAVQEQVQAQPQPHASAPEMTQAQAPGQAQGVVQAQAPAPETTQTQILALAQGVLPAQAQPEQDDDELTQDEDPVRELHPRPLLGLPPIPMFDLNISPVPLGRPGELDPAALAAAAAPLLAAAAAAVAAKTAAAAAAAAGQPHKRPRSRSSNGAPSKPTSRSQTPAAQAAATSNPVLDNLALALVPVDPAAAQAGVRLTRSAGGRVVRRPARFMADEVGVDDSADEDYEQDAAEEAELGSEDEAAVRAAGLLDDAEVQDIAATLMQVRAGRAPARQPGQRRARVKYSDEEIHAILDGLLKLTEQQRESAWATIKRDAGLILTKRSNVDLKDKWRNLQLQWYKNELTPELSAKVERVKAKTDHQGPWPPDKVW